MGFLPYGSGSTFPSAPQRGLSEPSLLAGLGNMNHTVNPDLSTLMSNFGNSSKSSLIGMGGGPSKPLGTSGLIGSSGNAPSSNSLNQGVSSPGLTFDPSDFPPIVNSVNHSQSQAFPGNPQHRNYVSAIAKSGGGIPSSFGSGTPNQNSFSGSSMQAPPEFSIDQDFPALPVAHSSAAPVNSSMASASIQSTHSLTAASGAALKSQAGQRLQRSQSGGGGSSSSPYAETTTNGNSLELLGEHYVGNIPKNMICDQFGMIGLLKLIQIDATYETLAPGVNLATVGIANWPTPGYVSLCIHIKVLALDRLMGVISRYPTCSLHLSLWYFNVRTVKCSLFQSISPHTFSCVQTFHLENVFFLPLLYALTSSGIYIFNGLSCFFF